MTDITPDELEACCVCKTHRVLVQAGKLPAGDVDSLNDTDKARLLVVAMSEKIIQQAYTHMGLRAMGLKAISALPQGHTFPPHIQKILDEWNEEIKAEKRYMLNKTKEIAHVDLTPTDRPPLECFGNIEESEKQGLLAMGGGIAVENTPEAIDLLLEAGDKYANTPRGKDYLLAIMDIARTDGETKGENLILTGKNWRATLKMVDTPLGPAVVCAFSTRTVPRE